MSKIQKKVKKTLADLQVPNSEFEKHYTPETKAMIHPEGETQSAEPKPAPKPKHKTAAKRK